jgi:type III secretion protein Q
MMNEDATQVTETVPGNSRRTLPSAPAPRAKLHPVLKLTRAHLAVSRRPSAAASFSAAASRLAQKLGPQLKGALSCKASLLPSSLHPFSHLAARALFFTFDLGGESLAVLELDLLGVGAVLAKITGGQEPVSLPMKLTAIEEAALGWVALAALAELRAEPAFPGLQPRLVCLTMDRGDILRQVDARLRHVAVQLELDLAGTRSLGRLLVPAQWLQARFDALPSEPLPKAHDAVLSAALQVRCFIGSALLPRRDAASLTVGDVVLFTGVSHRPEGLTGPGRLVATSFELRGSFTQSGFTLTRAFERPTQESSMSVDPSVPVEVEVELTRLRLPLSQLGSVHPGSVIPLHVNAAQQVVLRIGDKAVARAELVELEGEIGARIIAML